MKRSTPSAASPVAKKSKGDGGDGSHRQRLPHVADKAGQPARLRRCAALWNCDDASEWTRWEAKYDGVVSRHACAKEARDVAAVIAAARERAKDVDGEHHVSGLHLTSAEIVAFWKLKMAGNAKRPQGGDAMLSRNAKDAARITNAAFQIAAALKDEVWHSLDQLDGLLRAVDALSKGTPPDALFQVGPATASMLLGAFYDYVPFFSDEAAKTVVSPSLKYTRKEYETYFLAMVRRRIELWGSGVDDGALSLVGMERAMWAASYERDA